MNISQFNIPRPNSSVALQPGVLLVAAPGLSEFHFNHSAILLVEYQPGSPALGVVLNRRVPHTLKEVLSPVDSKGIPDDIPLFNGGPVGTDRLVFLHRIPQLVGGGHHLANGVHFWGDFSQVKEYLREGMPVDGNIRFFCGYSGWEAGQLEQEIADGVWQVAVPPEDFRLLEGEEAGYWMELVRSFGDEFSSWLLQPMHPSDN